MPRATTYVTFNFDRVLEAALTVGASISIGAGAYDFATEVGASEKDLGVLAQLCARLVPLTTAVFVSLRTDPEEGWKLLLVSVRTSASTAALVAAEDSLHDALFDQIPGAIRASLSITYEPNS